MKGLVASIGPGGHLPKLIAFTLVGASLLAATVSSLTGRQAGTPPPAAVVAERDLAFADRPDGGVAVQDAGNGRLIEVFQGEQGFLRGTLRGFARSRHLDGVTAAPQSFRLTRWSDDRLTLDDPATGRHVELSAFGADNTIVFARILYAKEAGS
jgi:putative photosynthetic complex assembly protein